MNTGENKKRFKKSEEFALCFIVYTVFCKTFKEGNDSPVGKIFLMILIQGTLVLFFKVLAWFYMASLFPRHPALRVMGFYGCMHKTVAAGVPLVQAMYGDDPRLSMYLLPLLVYHPTQLIVGTFLMPKLAAWVIKEDLKIAVEKAETGDSEDLQKFLDKATSAEQFDDTALLERAKALVKEETTSA